MRRLTLALFVALLAASPALGQDGAEWERRLADPSADARDAATAELAALGSDATAILDALSASDDPEVRSRAGWLLVRLAGLPSDLFAQSRAALHLPDTPALFAPFSMEVLVPVLGQDAARTGCGCVLCERLAERGHNVGEPIGLAVGADERDDAALVRALVAWLTAAFDDAERFDVDDEHTLRGDWDVDAWGARPRFDVAVLDGGTPIAYFEIEHGGVFTRSGPPNATTREQWERYAIADAARGVPFHLVIPAALSDRQRRGALDAMVCAIRTARTRAELPALSTDEIERLGGARTWTWTRAREASADE